MKETIIKIVLILIIVLTFIWGIEILKCEILTCRYGIDFDTIYREFTMLEEIEYLKVLNYTDSFARVYYVSKNRSSGDILFFAKEKNKWIVENWKTIWSKSGSADDFVWPYIR